MVTWCALTDDPGELLQPWFEGGAPSGIEFLPDVGNVFPVANAGGVEPFADLATDYQAFENYKGVDGDEDVFNTLEGFADRGREGAPWLERCSTLEEVKEFLEGELPILNKVALIIQTKDGRAKKRID